MPCISVPGLVGGEFLHTCGSVHTSVSYCRAVVPDTAVLAAQMRERKQYSIAGNHYYCIL